MFGETQYASKEDGQPSPFEQFGFEPGATCITGYRSNLQVPPARRNESSVLCLAIRLSRKFLLANDWIGRPGADLLATVLGEAAAVHFFGDIFNRAMNFQVRSGPFLFVVH